MSGDRTRWLALDVGGANLKAAHSEGPVRSVPFEVWKRPDDLSDALARLGETLPEADTIALTMTAELCDCYPSKAAGVHAVLDAVQRAFASRPIRVWGTDGRFHPPSDVQVSPGLAAASNWLALATVAARMVRTLGPALLIDIGSTTTDLIPLAGGEVRALGRTDTRRLQTGELVYAGVRRTPLFALADELPFRGVPTGLAAELFASTLDVYLTLGRIPEDPRDESTADGRPATVEAARHRLARMVGADGEEFTAADALDLSRSAHEALLSRLERAARRACDSTVGRPRGAVIAGSGGFLARALADRLFGPAGRVVELERVWGPVAASAGCAAALVALAEDRDVWPA